jgi:ubiquinone/menaquinone biosynthesis C-methylase UbiE
MIRSTVPPAQILAWIRARLDLVPTNSAGGLYDRMESQSGRCLPIPYEPFDPAKRAHFCDRGRILDYALAAGSGRVLDFGPGDGWPSLLIAPFVTAVTGVDASARRVAVCEENARRQGLANATFLHVPAGRPLPFPDRSFDAVVAASSVEQTPDPRAILAEFHRVLRPGGVLRIFYEALARYRGGREIEAEPCAGDLLVYDRDPDAERVTHYFVEGPLETARAALTFSTLHPSGPTLARWLREAGFAAVRPTEDGGRAAAALFDRIPPANRPRTLEGTDTLLRSIAAAALTTPRPLTGDPMLTAVAS